MAPDETLDRLRDVVPTRLSSRGDGRQDKKQIIRLPFSSCGEPGDQVPFLFTLRGFEALIRLGQQASYIFNPAY
jgi:hypothetical protein